MTGYHTHKNCIDACLNCAAICNHCASSCTQEENIKMMAKCIQLDMECATICYAAAQLMSLGSEKAKDICRMCADICELAVMNVANMKLSIARNVQGHVSSVQKNAVKWQLKLLIQVCLNF